jgi:hypothetical protein
VDKKDIRRIERQWRKENKRSREMGLREKLASFLPPYMVPGNVGHINQVTWPFWETVKFNFGANPTWSSSTKQVQSFQVTQEAAWLVTAISRKSYSYDTAGELAPLQLIITDRQSSRQFNDRPIPLQIIGKRSRSTILPTPLLFMPNAFIDITMTSWVTNTMTTTGQGSHDITLFGYRIRVGDEKAVLSTVFG